jgi:serine phosphatase RsbU (regulator of sigma subunit)
VFALGRRRLRPGERVIVYSDGVVDRMTARGGRFGLAGIRAAAEGRSGASAAGAARAMQNAVVGASPEALEDDAAVVVLAVS